MTGTTALQQRSLFVAWRDPESGSIHPIGELIRTLRPDGEHYSFAYLELAERLPGFEPLPGLPDLHRCYRANRLFPVFANRVMPRTRPEFDLLARSVDLAGDADPFEVLARSGGRRATDRIEVFLPPERTPDGHSCVLFFVRGIRHIEGASDAVARLHPGDRLVLVDDPTNAFNTRALVLRASDGHQVGWIPDYLVGHVHELHQLNRREPNVTVEHVNDATVAGHIRLLCRLAAPWPDGYEPFSDAAFHTLAPLD